MNPRPPAPKAGALPLRHSPVGWPTVLLRWRGAEGRSVHSPLLMKSTVEPLEGNKVKVSVELDESEFDKAIDNAFRAISREVSAEDVCRGVGE